jgi:two-component sensor histidine kinase
MLGALLVLAALLLSAFAVLGTIAGNGPFAQSTQNDSFLLLLAFMISVSVPSLALSADVAVRKRNETHVMFIMRELSHRSKNLLAVVQGVANQIGRRTDNFESFRSAFATRLQAIAQTHDLLVQANWEGAQICDLVQLHLAPFQSAAEALIVEGPELRLSAKAAEQIGLAFYELATNAAKYGALSLPTGVVEIRWELEIDDTHTKRLRVTWQEVGGPKVHETRSRGFGSVVLTKLVPMALGGTASLTFDHDGAKWLFSTPANSVLR